MPPSFSRASVRARARLNWGYRPKVIRTRLAAGPYTSVDDFAPVGVTRSESPITLESNRSKRPAFGLARSQALSVSIKVGICHPHFRQPAGGRVTFPGYICQRFSATTCDTAHP